MSIFLVVAIAALSCSLRCQSDQLNNGLHLGDPTRLRKVLQKAARGESLKLVVIGGSNSAGGGIEKDESSLDGLYYNVFTGWWDQTIGKKTGAVLQRHNLAIGAMGSEFFAFCYKTFIRAPDEVLDIVLVEQSVNFNMIGKAEPLEQLTRQLLGHQSQPAIIFISLFSAMGLNPTTGGINNERCSNLEDYGQTELERHYQITSVSLRDIICPLSESGTREFGRKRKMITSDKSHVGSKAHALVAQTLISHVQKTFNDVTIGWSGISREIATIPRPLLVTVPLTAPLCWTDITPDTSRHFSPTLAVEILSKHGFGFSLTKIGQSVRTDAFGGWLAKDVGSRIVFRVLVPRSSTQTRSIILLVHTFGDSGGEAEVFLDNAATKTKVSSKLSSGQNELNTLLSRVAPGYHDVTVKLVSSGHFMVSGLLVGPPELDIKRFV